MTPIIALLCAFLGLILCLSLFSYRALFFPRFRTAEYTKNSGLEKGEFEAAFLDLPWRGFAVDSPHGYGISGSYLASREKGASTALFLHGITWTRFGMFKYMKTFVERGWNVAAIDLAGHGDTVAPRKFGPAYGFYEKDDAAAALGALRGIFPDTPWMGLVGESLGAATALQCAGLEARDARDQPGFVVADCPFSGIMDELDYRLGKLGMPRFVRRPAETCVSLLCRVFRGFGLEEASPMKAMCASNIPVLFIHGIEDAYVPCSMSIAMYNERVKAGKKATELLLVPGARHAKSFMTDPELWEARVFAFLDRVTMERKKNPGDRAPDAYSS